MSSSKSNDANKSLVIYESHSVWMNNLLQKLGVIQITDNNDEQQDSKNGDKKLSINGNNNEDNDLINESDDNSEDYDDEKECDNYLKNLDAKDWKNQDHYRVLGLSKKRINASEAQIKKSYRKIVLRHHPDKQGKNIDLNCHYFSCITKAYEILSDPIKRRSYDSVDPTFDDTVPNATTYNKNRFFEIFPPVFELNERWSIKKPVPSIGDENSTFEEIDNFYKFWYNFESWREYSYLDEEEKEKGENREERRYLDKQNKIARAQRKKEEMQRIRLLVDNAYQCDPRVVRFKEDEKRRRQQQKQARQESIRAKKEEEERLQREKLEQELAEKKRKEEEEKRKKDEERKQKEALKKKTKKEIKLLETLLQNENYFADSQDSALKIEHMKECDKMTKLFSLEQIIEFRKKLESFNKHNDKKQYFLSEIEKMNKKLEEERNELINSSTSTTAAATSGSANTSTKKHWSYDDVQLLIKAVKLFPPGTPNRWTVIANYVNDKTDSNIVRNHRDVLEKAKDLQNSNEQQQDLREEANKNAFKKLEIHATEKATTIAQESVPSQRYDAPSSILEVNDSPWTNEEQQLLEQAMKTYPSNLGTERWNLIAECIPNRSRADCIKRYKYLVELVKAKNMAKNKAKKPS